MAAGKTLQTIAIIQARMGSTRLPGKVMKNIGGQPMLGWVANRVSRASLLDQVVIATSVSADDDVIAQFGAGRSLAIFRGSELDVLDRYYQAALAFKADTVVRITADCPLIEPTLVDHTISEFYRERPDYASNTLVRTYPRGMDTEVMTMAALTRAWKEAKEQYQRIHATPYLYQSGLFRTLSVENDIDYSRYRWTVDTSEDLEFIRALSNRLGPGDALRWLDVIALVDREPELAAINSQVHQKALHEG